jgi:hypothetical protein
MHIRRTLAVLLTVASALMGTAAAADAATVRPVALWGMNEPAGARTMLDSSGNDLRGSVGGEVLSGVRASGATGYRFTRLDPDTPPAHPRHVVTVPDRSALDPGTRDYAITVRLRTTYQFGNIIQKGQATAAGGNFKMQIPRGIVQCLFRGSSGSRLVTAPHAVNDGRWHTVRCERTGTGVALIVDGSTVARRSGWTGRISNSWPVSIGGKTSCDQIEVGCDYYAGDIDYVEIDAR